MFSQYSWGDFFKVMGSATVVYYSVVGWVFYRENIRNILAKLSAPPAETPQQADNEPDEDEEPQGNIRSFFDVSTYHQPTPVIETPQAKASDPAPSVTEAPAPKGSPKSKSKAKEKQATEKPKPKHQAATPKPESKTKKPVSQRHKDVNLPETPIFEDVKPDDLFMPLSGTIVPQGEQKLQQVVAAAQELKEAESGEVVAAASASEDALQLAEVINGQKIAFPSSFNFSRKQ